MAMTLRIYIDIDTATEARLFKLVTEKDLTIEELCENAVAEAALSEFRSRPLNDDPGRNSAS